jgi:hypothetical protein
MGLGLWTAVLMASLLGLDDPVRTTFIGTWVALTGGIPDMFRSSGNATADGISAMIFSNNFEKHFARAAAVVPLALSAAGCFHYAYVPVAQAPVGGDVRVHVSEPGFARLNESRRDDVPLRSPTIEGRLVSATARELLVSVSVPAPINAAPAVELHQRVMIPVADVLQVERRELDRTKTTLLGVGTAAIVAAIIVRSVSGTFGGTTTEPGPQPGEVRVPAATASLPSPRYLFPRPPAARTSFHSR